MLFGFRNPFTRAGRTATPLEARLMIQQGAQVIDVREPDEFAHGTIPSSENVPLSLIERDCDLALRRLAWIGDAPLILVCRSGTRSQAACARLHDSLGERVINLQGGLLAWVGEGLPVHHPNAAARV